MTENDHTTDNGHSATGGNVDEWTGEEVAKGLEQWLKKRRDEYPQNFATWVAIDRLLDEARDTAVEGFLPWQRVSEESDG